MFDPAQRIEGMRQANAIVREFICTSTRGWRMHPESMYTSACPHSFCSFFLLFQRRGSTRRRKRSLSRCQATRCTLLIRSDHSKYPSSLQCAPRLRSLTIVFHIQIARSTGLTAEMDNIVKEYSALRYACAGCCS